MTWANAYQWESIPNPNYREWRCSLCGAVVIGGGAAEPPPCDGELCKRLRAIEERLEELEGGDDE